MGCKGILQKNGGGRYSLPRFHRSTSYPLASCSSAELASVSLDRRIVADACISATLVAQANGKSNCRRREE
jgi:hypothetical protein